MKEHSLNAIAEVRAATTLRFDDERYTRSRTVEGGTVRQLRSNRAIPSLRFLPGILCASGICTIAAQPARTVVEYANPTTIRTLPQHAPLLDLGGSAGGAMDFLRIVTILPRGDGGFIVVNGATSELRFFDATGHFVSSAGRKGHGPGEYSGVREVGFLPHDSIAVFDPSERRLSILGPNGGFVRSFPITAPFDGGGSATHMIALTDGTLLIGYSEVRTMAPQPDAVTFWQRLYRYSTTGEIRGGGPLRLPDSEHFVQASTPRMGGVAYWNLAFGRAMTVRAGPRSILDGDGTDWSVEERDLNGAVIRTHHLQREVSPVTPRDKDAFREKSLEGSQGEDRVIGERMVSEMPYPRTRPAYRRFETDGAGRLWLEVYPGLDQPENLWIRLDSRSRIAVAVALPEGLRPLAFTASRVYGVWRDSDDVEHVRVYSLEGI